MPSKSLPQSPTPFNSNDVTPTVTYSDLKHIDLSAIASCDCFSRPFLGTKVSTSPYSYVELFHQQVHKDSITLGKQPPSALSPTLSKILKTSLKDYQPGKLSNPFYGPIQIGFPQRENILQLELILKFSISPRETHWVQLAYYGTKLIRFLVRILGIMNRSTYCFNSVKTMKLQSV